MFSKLLYPENAIDVDMDFCYSVNLFDCRIMRAVYVLKLFMLVSLYLVWFCKLMMIRKKEKHTNGFGYHCG